MRQGSHVLVIGGPVPPGADAITLGSVIFVRASAANDEYLLRHELVHVRQWRRHGVIRFLVRYLSPYMYWRLAGKGHHGAYLRIPFEIEADWVARRTLGAAPVEAETNQRAPLA